MQRIDGPTVSATLPAPVPTGAGRSAPGYFSRGDPVAGIAPTVLDADWANMVQEEISTVIEHSGATLDKANHGQLLAALLATFVAQGSSAGATIGASQISVPLPGGVILKAGTLTGSFSEQSVPVVFDTPFPDRCFVAIPVAINASGSNTRDIWAQRQALSAAGFTAVLQYPGGSNNSQSSDGIDWIAIGN